GRGGRHELRGYSAPARWRRLEACRCRDQSSMDRTGAALRKRISSRLKDFVLYRAAAEGTDLRASTEGPYADDCRGIDSADCLRQSRRAHCGAYGAAQRGDCDTHGPGRFAVARAEAALDRESSVGV